MPDQRMSKKEEADLIKELEDKAALIRTFLNQDKKLKPLTTESKRSLRQVLETIDLGNIDPDQLLAQGIADLEASGVKQGDRGVNIDAVDKTSPAGQAALNLVNFERELSTGRGRMQASLECLNGSPDVEKLETALNSAAQAFSNAANAARKVTSYKHSMSAKESKSSTSEGVVMADQRMSKKEEADLIRQLESKIKLMDRFVDKNGQLKNLKTPQDYETFKSAYAAIEFDISEGIEGLLDQGIQDLESCGMKDGNNVFAKYVEGTKFLDDSTLPADEHFGTVIKTGRYMPQGMSGRGENERVDRTRNQVRDKALELYSKDAKKAVNDPDHEKQVLGDLVDLTSVHATALTAAKQVIHISVSDSLQSDDLDERGFQEQRLAEKIKAVSDGLKDTLNAVRQIISHNRVMSAKEFQASTSVPYRKRPRNMRQIDTLLAQLEEPAPRSRF